MKSQCYSFAPIILAVTVLACGLDAKAAESAPLQATLVKKLVNGKENWSAEVPVKTNRVMRVETSRDIAHWEELFTHRTTRDPFSLSIYTIREQSRFYRFVDLGDYVDIKITQDLPEHIEVPEGGTLRLNAHYIGSVATAEWTRSLSASTRVIPTGPTNALVLENVQLADAGSYHYWLSGLSNGKYSQVCRVTVIPANPFAPASIFGKSFTVAITEGRAPFMTVGSYTFVAASSGSEYVIIPQTSFRASSGDCIYTLTDRATAKMTIWDNLLGKVDATVTFLTPFAGKIEMNRSPLPGYQIGNFVLN